MTAPARAVKQVQRVGARSNRYDHHPVELSDGRTLVTRQWMGFHSPHDAARIRDVARAQRERWAKGVRRPGETPIEVLCTLHPVTRRRSGLLIDAAAVEAALDR